MNKNKLVKFVQEELNARYGLRLKNDGLIGNQTMSALSKVGAIPTKYTKGRRLVAFIQYLTLVEPAVEDVALDGLWGPDTANAYAELIQLRNAGRVIKWRDDAMADTHPSWPRYEQFVDFYGKPGDSKNLVMTPIPYPMRLAWQLETSVTRVKCHKKVAPYVQEMLEKVLEEYTFDGLRECNLDKYAGMYNYRKMRGGSKLSTHSWGVAIDIDSAGSPMRAGYPNASLSRPECARFIDCFESVGCMSLGRKKNFDWMHFSFQSY